MSQMIIFPCMILMSMYNITCVQKSKLESVNTHLRAGLSMQSTQWIGVNIELGAVQPLPTVQPHLADLNECVDAVQGQRGQVWHVHDVIHRATRPDVVKRFLGTENMTAQNELHLQSCFIDSLVDSVFNQSL